MKNCPAFKHGILIFVVLCLPPMLLASQVETYPLPSVYPESQTFALKVNGIAVPVTEFVIKGNVHYHYAHFSFSGRFIYHNAGVRQKQHNRLFTGRRGDPRYREKDRL